MTRVDCIPDALAAAARWRLLALLFERPRPGWLAEVGALAAEVDDATLRTAADAARHADEGGYLAQLGPGGMASPREVAHAGFRDPGWVLADVARYYGAFAYTPRTEDPLDHVAVEAGFVAYLHLKEAFARAAGDDEAATVAGEAREAFVAQHLASIPGPLARALAGVGAPHLLGAAAALAAFVPAAPPTGVAPEDPLAAGCGACARS